jgi:hypothetical protein
MGAMGGGTQLHACIREGLRNIKSLLLPKTEMSLPKTELLP